MKLICRHLLLFVLSGLSSLPIASAQVLAAWELSGLLGITAGPVNATTLGPNVTNATLSRNPAGLTGFGSHRRFWGYKLDQRGLRCNRLYRQRLLHHRNYH